MKAEPITEETSTTTSRIEGLHRITAGSVIAGVCTGIGQFFGIDANIVRILFVLLTLFGGSGIIIYILLWIVLPSDQIPSHDTINPMTTSPFVERYGHSGRFWAGLIIIGLGVVFLLNNLGFLSDNILNTYWPIILIVVGLAVLLRKR